LLAGINKFRFYNVVKPTCGGRWVLNTEVAVILSADGVDDAAISAELNKLEKSRERIPAVTAR
jgi:hypothetical protein